MVLTLGTAAAMLLAQPLAAGRLGCGSQPWQIMLVCYLRVLMLQLVNGLAVMVKIALGLTLTLTLTPTPTLTLTPTPTPTPRTLTLTRFDATPPDVALRHPRKPPPV